jgi:hypothetical protein
MLLGFVYGILLMIFVVWCFTVYWSYQMRDLGSYFELLATALGLDKEDEDK